jgi:hypothetical protein
VDPDGRVSIKRYGFPKRLKARHQKQWLTKAIYWQSGVTENAMVLAEGTILGRPMTAEDRAEVTRRTNHMLHIVEICLVGLACGPVGPVLPVDQRRTGCCRPPVRRRKLH